MPSLIGVHLRACLAVVAALALIAAARCVVLPILSLMLGAACPFSELWTLGLNAWPECTLRHLRCSRQEANLYPQSALAVLHCSLPRCEMPCAQTPDVGRSPRTGRLEQRRPTARTFRYRKRRSPRSRLGLGAAVGAIGHLSGYQDTALMEIFPARIDTPAFAPHIHTRSTGSPCTRRSDPSRRPTSIIALHTPGNAVRLAVAL